MKLITIDDIWKLPGGIVYRCWTTKDEVEANHPDAETVYVYSPDGAYSIYYVPVREG